VTALALFVGGWAPGAGPAQAAPGMTLQTDIRYGTAGGEALLLDAYVPTTPGDRRPGVVLVHGGAWRGGDKDEFAVEARRLAALGWVAFSVNYRLDARPALPAEVDDVQTAVRWVREHASEYGVDPARIGALGASAGGHLVAMLATVGEGPLDDGARIRSAVSWSGPMDLTRLAGDPRVGGLTVGLLACRASACPDQWSLASPVGHVEATDAPLLLINSTDELVPLDQGQVMAARLQAAGVEHRLDVLPGSRHGHVFRDDVWGATVDFLRTSLEPPAPPTPDVEMLRPAEAEAEGSSGGWSPATLVVTSLVVGLAVGGLIAGAAWRSRSTPAG